MFLKRLNLFFLVVTILGSIFLVFSWYKAYEFKNNPLSKKYQDQIQKKQKELEYLAYKHFNIKRKFNIKISEKMPNKLFGAATYTLNNQIIIYLNKKHFFESSEYMINDVLPHEYAHAVMFALNDFTKQNGGHTKKWQMICQKLEGEKCNRFVNNKDIILGKTNIF